MRSCCLWHGSMHKFELIISCHSFRIIMTWIAFILGNNVICTTEIFVWHVWHTARDLCGLYDWSSYNSYAFLLGVRTGWHPDIELLMEHPEVAGKTRWCCYHKMTISFWTIFGCTGNMKDQILIDVFHTDKSIEWQLVHVSWIPLFGSANGFLWLKLIPENGIFLMEPPQKKYVFHA